MTLASLDAALRHADWVVGVDEVGYGAMAGPLVTCAVATPPHWRLDGLKDSKRLSPAKRQRYFGLISAEQLPMAYGWVMPDLVDRVGVYTARLDALSSAVLSCLELVKAQGNCVVVVDGVDRPPGLPAGALCLPKADDLVPAVSAGSVMAKVRHDRYMWDLSAQYANYGFDAHMGYATASHMAALTTWGPIPGVHRLSYRNVREGVRVFQRRQRALARLEEWQLLQSATLDSTRFNPLSSLSPPLSASDSQTK